jgi:5-methylcytosine-specific restriction endonuclease McrA
MKTVQICWECPECDGHPHLCRNKRCSLYSFRPDRYQAYKKDWPTISKAIRERDNSTCLLCGKRIPAGKQAPVHHIDYHKWHNDPLNLATLCQGCHLKIHSPKFRGGYNHGDKQAFATTLSILVQKKYGTPAND